MKYTNKIVTNQGENTMSDQEEKRESNNVTISLPNFHRRKLVIMQDKLGVNRSGIIQRLIEHQSIFTLCRDMEMEGDNKED